MTDAELQRIVRISEAVEASLTDEERADFERVNNGMSEEERWKGAELLRDHFSWFQSQLPVGSYKLGQAKYEHDRIYEHFDACLKAWTRFLILAMSSRSRPWPVGTLIARRSGQQRRRGGGVEAGS